METICFSCNSSVPNNSNFCFSCGSKIKCTTCFTHILKDAKFCIECGEPIKKVDANTQNNSVKYKRNKEETSYEISLSDNIIGQDGLKDFLATIVGSRLDTTKSLDDTSFIELKTLASENETGNNNSSKDVNEGDKGNLLNITHSSDEFPHIDDVERVIECSESEWMAIYAFYNSSFGKEAFNINDVKKSYLQKRNTPSRANKFKREWDRLFPKTMQTVSDNVFRFKATGIEDIVSLIKNESSKKTNSSNRKSKSAAINKTHVKPIVISEFDVFKSDNKQSLQELFDDKKPDNTNDKILLIAYYVSKTIGQDYFNEGNIEYGYKALQLKDRPTHLRQTINNVKNSKLWFKDHESGGWTVERHAEIHLDKMPIIKESK